ncbi:MAG: carboxypeptidase regulatory-like domain-containing protein, partial [Candidatus Kapaibacteriota bacterium]
YENNLPTIIESQIHESKIRIRLKHNDDCCGKIIIHTLSSDSIALSGVEVKLNRGKDCVRKTKSGDASTVAFENVCPGNYWLRIAKEGYQVIEKEFSIEKCDTLEFRFILNKKEQDTCCNGVLSVEVVGNNEKLNGAIVKLRKNGSLLTTLSTKENQPVIFRELCPGTYSLLIIKEGFEAVERGVTLECNDSTFISVQMEEDTCCNSVLRIYVKNTEGSPLQNTKITICKLGNKLGYLSTNDSGFAVFRHLCSGVYAFDIQKDGYKSIEFSIEIGCNEEKEITKVLQLAKLDSCCNGSIKIIAKNNEEQPLVQANVSILKDGKKLGNNSTNNDGFVVFQKLCEGKYILIISKEGYKSIEFNVELGCNEEKVVTKFLNRDGKDTCCNGVAIIRVKNLSDSSIINGASVKMWKNGQIINKATTSEGIANFKNICSGEYCFSIFKDGFRTAEFSLTFECDDTVDVTKFLVSELKDTCCKGKVIFYIKDSTNNEPIKNTEVKLWKGNQKVASQTTNENGRVVFENLCEGEYQVSVFKSNYRGFEYNFNLGCNETKEIVRYLIEKNDTCCTARLKLRVLDSSSNSPISGARVQIKCNGETFADKNSNSEGWAVFENLCAPGTYSIRISSDGYQVREFTITFQECNTLQETVRLEK